MLSDELNEIELYPEEMSEIYGGVASPARQQEVISPSAISHKQFTNYPRLVTEAERNWSTSLQTVLDQPPISFPKRLLVGGAVFSMAFAAWATFGQIDEIGHARGQLVPKGEAYKIHPSEVGKVVNLPIAEGQQVKAGQLLAVLDPQVASDEVKRLEKVLEADRIQVMQTQSLSGKIRLEAEAIKAIAAADIQAQKATLDRAEANVATGKNILNQLRSDTEATRTRLDRLKPLLNVTKNLIVELQKSVDTSKARVAKLRPLVEAGSISQEYLFQAEQDLRDRESELTKGRLQDSASTKERVFEAEQNLRDRAANIIQSQGQLTEQLAEVRRLQAQVAQKQAEARQEQLEKDRKIQQLEVEMAQLRSKIVDTKNLLDAAKAQLKQRFLYAPVDGIVSSLNINHAGEVVKPGQTIAEIAPKNAPLILTANLPNREAGSLATGLPVQIKFDAYPYQDYGVVSGKVFSISPDAKQDEKLGAVYRVEVAIERDSVTANRQVIKFKAGQTASAEIVIRRRRVADILLDPIKHLQKGGISL